MTVVQAVRATPTLGQWLAICGDTPPEHMATVTAGHLTLDSRQLNAGDVFVALSGHQSDGRSFIPKALSAGAAAVVADSDGFVSRDSRVMAVASLRAKLPKLVKHYYQDPSAHMTVMAVTGTNGKTSIAEFTAQLLRAMDVSVGVIGTLGARTTSAPSDASNTTPDLVSLTRQLDLWRRSGLQYVAMEASSHALAQGRLDGLSIDVGVFSNLSRDHLDYHGSEQAYADAKLRLFRDLGPRYALYNADDPVAKRVRQIVPASSMGISMTDPSADVFIDVLTIAPLSCRLVTPAGVATISSQLVGAFNGFNIAAAIMSVVAMGYPFVDVAKAAENLEAVPGRLQCVPNDLGLEIMIDYAHTPDALQHVLSTLQANKTRSDGSSSIWLVFGCGGDRDQGKRRLMGEVAARQADRVVLTSDNPRNEEPEAIIAGIVEGMACAPDACIVDRAEAIAWVIANARQGDAIVIAGKGHEAYQDVRGQRLPSSDVALVESALAGVSL